MLLLSMRSAGQQCQCTYELGAVAAIRVSPRLLVEMCFWRQRALLAKASISRMVPVVLNVAVDSNQYLTGTLNGEERDFRVSAFC